MIERAERDGRLKPGGTIIEPTSGNTGIGLALVAAVKGYRLVLDDARHDERRGAGRCSPQYGATLELTPDTKGMHAAVRRAEELLAEHPDWYMPQQFNNRRTRSAPPHHRARDPAAAPRVDAFVAGVGTGGTITGVGDVLKKRKPGDEIIRGRARSVARACPGGNPASIATQRHRRRPSCPTCSTRASSIA
jgi:cysteine synthase A